MVSGEKLGFEALAKSAESILLNLIKKAHIPIVSVSSRTKGAESLVEKYKKKRYKNPTTDITDFVGLRVITYTEDDAIRVCELVKQSFNVDAKQSIDKGQQLEVDQIGYRSYHFICDLGEKRHALPEFDAFRAKVFEVQVRTILQHAWAEVEHDKNYKFSTVLPSALQRRLYLISGMLEIGDRELNQLSKDIDAYAKSVKVRVKEGKLDDELNTTTLLALVPEITKALKRTKVNNLNQAEAVNLVVKECLSLGIQSTTDFKALFTPKFLQAYDEVGISSTEVGFVRDAMMFSDLKRYMKEAWHTHWASTDSDTVEVLSKKYPKKEVIAIFRSYGILFHDQSGEWFEGQLPPGEEEPADYD